MTTTNKTATEESPRTFAIYRNGRKYDGGFSCSALAAQHARVLSSKYHGDTWTVADNRSVTVYEITTH